MHNSIAAVVVTFNRKKLLAEAIQSLHNQSYPVEKIIIIDNASTDGSKKYLQDLGLLNKHTHFVTLSDNLGGAGGFHYGMKEAMKFNVDWVCLSDDDAIYEQNYFEEIMKDCEMYPDIKAFAGTVREQGEICIYHRAKILNAITGQFDFYDKYKYQQNDPFKIDIFSFVGCVINAEIIKLIGLPDKDYFIRHDDSEYSLRVKGKTKILCVPRAVIDHKIKPKKESSSFVPDWKEYYGLRNHYFMTLKHSPHKYRTKFYVYTDLLKKEIAAIIKRKYKGNRKYRMQMLHEVFRSVLFKKKGKRQRYLP